MSAYSRRLGIDVGGSHISAAVIGNADSGWEPFFRTRITLNPDDSAYCIITALSNCIKELTAKAPEIEAVGIAFPGPFNYQNGVSEITNVGGKFEKTFGLHVRQGVQDFSGLPKAEFKFSNDAHCFAAGAYHMKGLKSKRTIFVTLGTGLGSAFMLDGELLHFHPDIPSSGAFFNQNFLDTTADDYFSTRWILNTAKQVSGTNIFSVKEFLESGSPHTQTIMSQFGQNLGCFLLPWLQKFQCNELVIGGNIAKAFPLFGSSLKRHLGDLSDTISILTIENSEDCIITGAAIIAGNAKLPTRKKIMRKTLQELLPLSASKTDTGFYDIYPSFPSGKKICRGFDSLAAEISDEKVVIIDGYGGVLWESFREQIHAALSRKNKSVFWYDVSACLKPAGSSRV